MRRGLESDFLEHEGKFVGISLGSDFCAEHEMGIGGLQKSFGLDLESKLGFEARKITKVPKELVYIQDERNSLLVYAPHLIEHIPVYDDNGRFKEFRDASEDEIKKNVTSFGDRRLDFRTHSNLATAWDDKSFGIRTRNEYIDYVVHLEDLYKAFKNLDLCITLGGGKGAFSNPGLCFLIYSSIPNELKEERRKGDEEWKRLKDYENSCGVKEFLKSKGKEWLALSVKRVDEETGEFLWWLNPMEQRMYNFGWFTEKDLREWGENKGPVIMSPEAEGDYKF